MSIPRQNLHETSSGPVGPGDGSDSAPALRAQRDLLGRCLVRYLDELDDREAELRKTQLQLNEIYNSRGFQVLSALSAARKSVRGFWRLPAALWNAFRDRQAVSAPVACAGAAELLRRPARKGCARPMRVLAIVDEFTELCFGGDCELWLPGPETADSALAVVEADFLFVESAWKGNGGRWLGRLDASSPAFLRLLEHARRRGIPTVFWNKEDPVHFEHFLPLARHFDWVLTTAQESVAAYKVALASERVGVMPFGCQPALHNPMDTDERRWAAMFAGSYYAKYPERNYSLTQLIADCAGLMPVEIFDRNHFSDDPDFRFPPELASHVVGGLPASEVGKAYRQFRFAINVNTVVDSRTMLSRRIFELLASGTVVVSNASPAVKRLFGDLVIAGDDAEVTTRIASLLEPLAWKRQALAGLRKVLEEHTWHKRLSGIASMLGLHAVVPPPPELWAVCPVDSAAQMEHVLGLAVKQTGNFRLFLIAAPSLPLDEIRIPTWVVLVSEEEAAGWLIPEQTMIAGWCAADWYGPNYLHDLVLGLSFGCVDGVGKEAYWLADEQLNGSIQNEGLEYRSVTTLSPRRALLRQGGRWFRDLGEAALAVRNDRAVEGLFGSLDSFNYCSNCEAPVEGALDTVAALDSGVSLQDFLGNESAASLQLHDKKPGSR